VPLVEKSYEEKKAPRRTKLQGEKGFQERRASRRELRGEGARGLT
jgi:hypothetical protein